MHSFAELNRRRHLLNGTRPPHSNTHDDTHSDTHEPSHEPSHNTHSPSHDPYEPPLSVSQPPPLLLDSVIDDQQMKPSIAESAESQPKTLIYSAGTVRSRYRNLRKDAETKANKKHAVVLRKHGLALQRESVDGGRRARASKRMPKDVKVEEDVQDPDEVVTSVPCPPGTVLVDDLVYSKYCTDGTYKTSLLVRVKRELQQGLCVLLRSPCVLPSTCVDNEISGQNLPILIAGRDSTTRSFEDIYRECKQILRSVCMSCISVSGHDMLPPIEEGRTRSGKLVYLEMLLYPKNHPCKPP
mmetsp:Transcript_9921/g.14936  ORF Transcript_9921/g.14936 Transcript_9921/m.14936 type:complete len:298 (+) Transcript_9921:98-991(+)